MIGNIRAKGESILSPQELLKKHSAVIQAALTVYTEHMNNAAADAHLEGLPGPSAAFLESVQKADAAYHDIVKYEEAEPALS